MGQTFSIERKLRKYNQLTNNGRVFDRDLSLRSDLGTRRDDDNEMVVTVLTDDEIRDREIWRDMKRRGFFQGSSLLQVNIIGPIGFQRRGSLRAEDLLRLQVAAPVLHPDPSRVSHRSSSAIAEARSNRWYPPSISTWEDFPDCVSNFTSDVVMETDDEDGRRAWRDLSKSFDEAKPVADEINEQIYLHDRVMIGLQWAGLIGEFVNGNRGLVGNPDFWVQRGQELGQDRSSFAIVGETKSTHNLPIPMESRDIVNQYNEAIASSTGDPTPAQIRAWSHVGHPISQIIGYMILNRCRYGMLTSATRTYFLQIKNIDDTDVVNISDAWFIGQPGYLRAISAMYNLSLNDNQPRLSTRRQRGWKVSTPPSMKMARSRKRARDGDDPGRPLTRSATQQGRQRAASGDSENPATTSPMPSLGFGRIDVVDFEDIDIRDPIGYGKRGTSFSALWRKEVQVAVKVFDATKPGGQDAFEKEIKAYLHLEDVWGELVPQPHFVSFAYGAWFLGMQMARHPPKDACLEDWGEVLDTLEQEHKFRHLDVWMGDRGDDWRNLMVIQDQKGRDRPIVIDLEDYELLST